nr:hypothetical protein [Tanacetum cinerariifolium]
MSSHKLCQVLIQHAILEMKFTYDSKSNLVDDSPNVFNPPPQPPTYSYEFCRNDACYGHDYELIKSSVENLVPIPSESEGIPENMCDVPFHNNSSPLDISKDQFKDFFDSNDDSTSINDDSFSIDDIEYVEASPPDFELISLEISSGSTTTHSDFSLYESFIFDLSINPFPPVDMSDFYEFVDELAHIISPPEYDCFSFKNEPNFRDFTMDVVEDTFSTREPRVHVHNVLPTHPTLQLNLDFILSSESLFAYVVWIFLPFISYLVAP